MRKNIFLLLFLFCITNTFAQKDWEKLPMTECEDRWVVTNNGGLDDSMGFVYMDAYKGITLNYVGSIKKDENGKFSFKEDSKKEVVFHIKNPSTVYLVPDEVLAQLGLPKKPKWLSAYKVGDHDIKGLYAMGKAYFKYDMRDKALKYLKKVEEKDENYQKVQYYLTRISWDLHDYEETYVHAKKFYDANTEDCYAMMLLGSAYARIAKISDAEQMYANMQQKCTSKRFKLKQHLATDISCAYLKDGDEPQYYKWKNLVLQNEKNPELKKQKESYFKYLEDNKEKVSHKAKESNQ
ncbi:hypothetical protein EDL99_07685 [Ornithobacterium rhinotracheale]|uniref:tetratricopeptide repeat protein n=1 Tax=Ornithobacterium rhinotracheale TaxID=28251 RepID=UPI00129CB6F2|nr:hypothetical protein [Ornithobacterium rhinotracheale]MRJ08745.1 hypothetical protein [Ornithobacterium rhinotracheale]UOH77110.1 hypothetical protein MT996_07760 [Ornithobacterium rhinotracheale]